MILLFLIMRCTPTIRELIVATPLSLSSPSATGLSALAPVQLARAQRLCAMTPSGHGFVFAFALPEHRWRVVRCSVPTGDDGR